MSTEALAEPQLRRLLRAGRALVARLDHEAVLEELLSTAREITGARYAALGILDEPRRGLERFVTDGIDEDTHRAIGDLPHGRGILGVLIDDPRPLRLASVGDDPRSYGFPPGHPSMSSFLGVPVLIRGEAWGNLYLTEKAGGEPFTGADEDAVVVLAEWAAIAVENARLYRGVEERRDALERAVAGLEATTAIARAVGGETDLDRVLELIAERGRALVDARALVIVLRDDDETFTVGAGGGQLDLTAPRSGGVEPGGPLARVMGSQAPARLSGPDSLGALPERLGVRDPSAALLVPLVFRSQVVGVLCAFDRLDEDAAFRSEHEHLLLAFAASAATAVATAKSVAEERLRHTLRSAEEERRRWARELHDDTLQSLGALRLLLASALRRGDGPEVAAAAAEAVDRLQQEIDNLRALITDLRPAALDHLGLAPALEALFARASAVHGLEIPAEVELDGGDAGSGGRLEPETETAVYRLVQEALTNAGRHSGATRARVQVLARDGRILVEIADDGHGFDPGTRTEGFGLRGMRERMELVGGKLAVESSPDGTVVRASVPARRR